jgi:hypothetical protein
VDNNINRLTEALLSVKNAVKNRGTQRLPYEMPLDIPRPDEWGLYTRYLFHFLQSVMPQGLQRPAPHAETAGKAPPLCKLLFLRQFPPGLAGDNDCRLH